MLPASKSAGKGKTEGENERTTKEKEVKIRKMGFFLLIIRG